MPHTKDDWIKIKANLERNYFIDLKIDGYDIRLKVVRTKNFLVHHIIICVNGQFNYEWVYTKKDEDPSFEDIRRRFLRKRNKGLSSVVSLRKDGWKKKDAEKYAARHMFTYYDPQWTSFEALKLHLIKNNNNISRASEKT